MASSVLHNRSHEMLPNRPLQQTNASPVRLNVSSCRDAAGAPPVAPRGRGPLDGDLDVRC